MKNCQFYVELQMHVVAWKTHIITIISLVECNDMNIAVSFRANFLDLRIYFEELNYNFLQEVPSYGLGDFWCK